MVVWNPPPPANRPPRRYMHTRQRPAFEWPTKVSVRMTVGKDHNNPLFSVMRVRTDANPIRTGDSWQRPHPPRGSHYGFDPGAPRAFSASGNTPALHAGIGGSIPPRSTIQAVNLIHGTGIPAECGAA